MAMSLNRVQLIGNVTRDPDMKQLPGGQVVTTVGMATNFTWTDSSGQKQNKAEYHNIVAWRKLGEICGQYLKKGSKVFFEGRIQTREWEGEDGVKRYRTEVVADNMIMLDGRRDGGMDAAAGYDRESAGLSRQNEADGMNVPAMSAADDVRIDDLPF